MEGINSDERYFEGLLTVQMKDKQGEITIVDELYKVLPVWIDRGAPISDTHSNRIVGKGINYSRTTVKSDDGSVLPAIKITGKIFKNYELDNVIWDKIKNNEYKGLSFGGATRSARSPIKMKDGSTAYALSDLEHYEVAVCKDPAVPMAIITDFNQIAKANFNSTVRDDGKMVIQCDNMGCIVNKTDLPAKDFAIRERNYEALSSGGGKPDKSLLLDTDKTDAYPEIKRDFVDDAEDKESKNFKDKFMEKKEMDTAIIDNPEEAKINEDRVEKGDGSTNTEDRNNRTDLNDLVSQKRQFNGTKGTLSEELPNMTIANPIKNGKNAADLNESQTFEQKVQALIREGKSRESAEKIVGSFVHKEAAGGNGMGGGSNSLGAGSMSGGGTLTTDSEGTNNPRHNNGCDCDCKDCTRNDKCDCCDKCKSKGLDITNTNSVGSSGAYNQDAPNGSRLNNKSDDDDDVDSMEELTPEGQEVYDEAKRYSTLNHFKSVNTRELNKVHGIMKVNAIQAKLKRNEFQEQSTSARVSPSGESKHLKDVRHPDGLAIREASTIDHRVGNTAPLERNDTSIKQPRQTGKRGAPKVDPRTRKKNPIKTLPKIKALELLIKEMIGVGSGIRGGGASYAHTQGQGESTQVTIVPPRPEDDRVASKKVKNRKE